MATSKANATFEVNIPAEDAAAAPAIGSAASVDDNRDLESKKASARIADDSKKKTTTAPGAGTAAIQAKEPVVDTSATKKTDVVSVGAATQSFGFGKDHLREAASRSRNKTI